MEITPKGPPESLLPGPNPLYDIDELFFETDLPITNQPGNSQSPQVLPHTHPLHHLMQLPSMISLPGTPSNAVEEDSEVGRVDSGFQSAEGFTAKTPNSPPIGTPSPSLRSEPEITKTDELPNNVDRAFQKTLISLYTPNPLSSETEERVFPPILELNHQVQSSGDLRHRHPPSFLTRIRSSSADLFASIRSSSVDTHIKVSKNRRKWGFPTWLRTASPRSWKARFAREADHLASLSRNPFYMPDGCGRHLWNLTVPGPAAAIADTAVNGVLLTATTTVLVGEAIASPAFLCCPCLSDHKDGFKEVTAFTATTAKELTGELLDSACRIIPIVGAPISYLGKASFEATSKCLKGWYYSIKSCLC